MGDTSSVFPAPRLGVARGTELISPQPLPTATLPSPVQSLPELLYETTQLMEVGRSPPELCRPQFVGGGPSRAPGPPPPARSHEARTGAWVLTSSDLISAVARVGGFTNSSMSEPCCALDGQPRAGLTADLCSLSTQGDSGSL